MSGVHAAPGKQMTSKVSVQSVLVCDSRVNVLSEEGKHELLYIPSKAAHFPWQSQEAHWRISYNKAADRMGATGLGKFSVAPSKVKANMAGAGATYANRSGANRPCAKHTRKHSTLQCVFTVCAVSLHNFAQCACLCLRRLFMSHRRL